MLLSLMTLSDAAPPNVLAHPTVPSALAHADWLHGTVINFFRLDTAGNC